MRFVCGDCPICCKTESEMVSYCQSDTQCYAIPLSISIIIGICMSVLLVGIASLWSIYFCCRERKMQGETPEEREEQIKIGHSQHEVKQMRSNKEMEHHGKQKKYQSFFYLTQHRFSVHPVLSQRRLQ